MLLYPVTVRYSPELPANGIKLPADMSPKFSTGKPVNLCFGKRKVSLTITGFHQPASSRCLSLSEKAGEILLLPTHVKSNLLFDRDRGCLRLGPLIGIFANRLCKTTKPFGEQTSFFCSLKSKAVEANSFVFAFSPSDINWQNETITAWIPPPTHCTKVPWETLTLPFPDSIYDRGLFPKGEKRRAAAKARKILRNYPDVKLFNPAFFGKWKTHKLLSKHELLFPHLPDTQLYYSMTDIHDMLKKHETVYLKPSGGSSGRGIIRVTANNTGYDVDLRVAKQVMTLRNLKRNDLETHLKPLLEGRRYIVQQGLNLARINSCPFDIRLLMQRDRQGIWKRTGMAVRIASPGSYISNIHAGGRAEQITTVLPKALPDLRTSAKTIRDIRRLSSLIASLITNEGNPLFGEVAIDLGVDVSGKVWIIELNAIPGRSVFRRIKAKEALARAISRPMEYASFIAGFGTRSNPK